MIKRKVLGSFILLFLIASLFLLAFDVLLSLVKEERPRFHGDALLSAREPRGHDNQPERIPRKLQEYSRDLDSARLLEYSKLVEYSTRGASLHPLFDREDFLVDPLPLFPGIGEIDLRTVAREGVLALSVATKDDYEEGAQMLEVFKRQRHGEGEYFLFCHSEKLAGRYRKGEEEGHVGMVPLEWVSFLKETAFQVDPKGGKGNKLKLSSPFVKSAVVLRLLQLNFTIIYSDLDLREKWSIDVLRSSKRLKEENNAFYGLLASGDYLKNQREIEKQKEFPRDVNAYLAPLVDPSFFVVWPSTLTIRLFELISLNLLKRKDSPSEFQIYNEALDSLEMKINGANSGRVRYRNAPGYRLDNS